MSNDFGMWLVNQLKEIKTILTEARQTYDEDLESFCDEVLNKK